MGQEKSLFNIRRTQPHYCLARFRELVFASPHQVDKQCGCLNGIKPNERVVKCRWVKFKWEEVKSRQV